MYGINLVFSIYESALNFLDFTNSERACLKLRLLRLVGKDLGISREFSQAMSEVMRIREGG